MRSNDVIRAKLATMIQLISQSQVELTSPCPCKTGASEAPTPTMARVKNCFFAAQKC